MNNTIEIDRDEIEVTPQMQKRFWEHNINPITGKIEYYQNRASKIDATKHKVATKPNAYHNLQI